MPRDEVIIPFARQGSRLVLRERDALPGALRADGSETSSDVRAPLVEQPFRFARLGVGRGRELRFVARTKSLAVLLPHGVGNALACAPPAVCFSLQTGHGYTCAMYRPVYSRRGRNANAL